LTCWYEGKSQNRAKSILARNLQSMKNTRNKFLHKNKILSREQKGEEITVKAVSLKRSLQNVRFGKKGAKHGSSNFSLGRATRRRSKFNLLRRNLALNDRKETKGKAQRNSACKFQMQDMDKTPPY